MTRAHGTQRRYETDGCRCAPCRATISERLKRHRRNIRERFAADPTAAPHGTLSGYRNWKCRCDDCKVAAATYNKAYRTRRTQQLARIEEDANA